ncbi:glycosyltransferase family 1 protein [Fistulina hepatica ATCC 64428]|uniref:Glycosyltransferase family 1 protein n=1 Tax=Fistulina hepatica ATCC 64428 TaxID=1128425 RepID=A0A0D7A748_9AGAR|nr:glycosyltransferase family 1 protein [Fistulina hepatica ATCC 64428]
MGKGLASVARVEPDGRISITLDLKKHLPDLPQDHAPDVDEVGTDAKHWNSYPAMSIVVMIVGSRGDVQPYVALGRRLKRDGHRLRIATHETFRSFVNENDLEFYDIGGDPRELMSYMVKNPGLVPGVDSLTNGDIGRKRTMLKQMMAGCWASCHSPCEKTGKAFIADVIISNPPAFAHIHCAEAMGIPVHMSFSECPTSDFPHPLVNVDSSNAGNGLTNYLSYALTDFLTWHGMGDIINELRNKELGLPSLSIRSGPSVLDRLKVPWTYCMSPALVPKPDDWKNHIDVVGFYFLDLAASYQPPEDLAAFLASGDPPVYVGFGSVVVDNPIEMTSKMGLYLVMTNCEYVSVPSHVFIIGNVPHDWLFAEGRVSAVVHHGGAGTTAIGLFNGRPTVVVPFFGDQAFWGSMVHRAGAGPQPIPPAKLSVETLKAAIEFSVSPPARLAAQQLADRIRNENGVEEGAQSFYRHLPLLNMRCDLDPTRMAVWWSNDYCLKLSAFAAQTLAEAKILKMDNLDLHRTKEYELRKVTADPVTGGAGAIFWTVTHYYASIAEIF